MKRHFFQKLFLPLILPALLWIFAVQSRPYLVSTRCVSQPETCTKESVFKLDQLSLGLNSTDADQYSYLTQNISGAIAFSIPFLLNPVLAVLGKIPFAVLAITIIRDLSLMLQITLWNGLATELSHLLSQRPRPFVYAHPLIYGLNPSNYTSFFSGHTSFTAASSLAVFLLFFRKKLPFWMLFIAAANAECLVLMTAYFRILAGRHFLTDVILGALSGSLIAWSVSYFHDSRERNHYSE